MSEILILDTKLEAERKAKQVPDPSGYHLLCMIPKIEDTYGDSAIIKADETVKNEEQTTVILFVAKVGPDAYKDVNKFPTGPWCQQGDFVLVRPYTGTRVLIHGTEWRLINDDSVQAVVQDPRGIRRA
jgi:co-chaperonin GroES (HSP10)